MVIRVSTTLRSGRTDAVTKWTNPLSLVARDGVELEKWGFKLAGDDWDKVHIGSQ